MIVFTFTYFADLDNFADSPTLHVMIQKAWTDIFKTAAILLASNPNKSFLVCHNLLYYMFLLRYRKLLMVIIVLISIEIFPLWACS